MLRQISSIRSYVNRHLYFQSSYLAVDTSCWGIQQVQYSQLLYTSITQWYIRAVNCYLRVLHNDIFSFPIPINISKRYIYGVLSILKSSHIVKPVLMANCEYRPPVSTDHNLDLPLCHCQSTLTCEQRPLLVIPVAGFYRQV